MNYKLRTHLGKNIFVTCNESLHSRALGIRLLNSCLSFWVKLRLCSDGREKYGYKTVILRREVKSRTILVIYALNTINSLFLFHKSFRYKISINIFYSAHKRFSIWCQESNCQSFYCSVMHTR